MTDQPGRQQPGPFSHELPSGQRVALGRPSVRHDPRTLMLRRYLVSGELPPLADKVDYSARARWLLGHNDAVGDCVQVGRANHVLVAAALSQQSVPLTDDDPFTAYQQLCGYRPGDPSTDQGCVELDSLNRWAQGATIGGIALEAFVGVQPQTGDFETIRYAIQLFGSCLIGLAMPLGWQENTGGDRVWDAGDQSTPHYAPGGWGGHCVILVGFDWTQPRPRFIAITWAAPQIITRDAMLGYCDERYGLLTSLWRQHVPENAIAFDQLSADLQRIRS